MRIRKAFAIGAVLFAAVGPAFAASTASAAIVRPDAFPCYGYGTGATYQDALTVAREDMGGDVTVGQRIITSGQNADGSWWVKISANCTLIQ